jgi:hypothetical protein
MPAGLLADVDQRAFATGMSRSDYIRLALMGKMERQNMIDFPKDVQPTARALRDDPEGVYWSED